MFLSNTNLPDAPESEAIEWITDPARLSFSGYFDRSAFGPPDATGRRQLIDRELARELLSYAIDTEANEYRNGEDPKYGSWLKCLEAGRSYLVGSDVPMQTFIRAHSSRLSRWQRLAYVWCMANPSRSLVLESHRSGYVYKVRKRGEYVEIGLPHQDHGGEKHWVTHDGKVKILVNVD